MPKLNKKQKLFLLERFALHFDEPTAAAKAFEEEFGVKLDRRQAEEYNLRKAHNRESVSEELRQYFDELKARLDEATLDIPIAHKAVRLRNLQILIDKLMAKPHPDAKRIAELQEIAAKEMGNLYTNRRDLTTGGQPFKALVGIDIDAV